jgi:hypothetical protein
MWPKASPSEWLTVAAVEAELHCATVASGTWVVALVLTALPLAALLPSEALAL